MKDLLLIENVTHRYGARRALEAISFPVGKSQWLGLLGPNGSGKSTLFRLLSTLLPVQQGRILWENGDLHHQREAFRRQLGVVFQSPALDPKLTVQENLMHHGHLYGLRGAALRARSAELLEKLRLTDRAQDWVEKLSGGLRRRVELAKGLLPRPQLLLLDEPSTGLDPAARRDFWNYLRREQAETGLTIILTTHLMEEAEACDQLVVLEEGRLIAHATPAELKSRVPGTVITIQGPAPETLQTKIRDRFQIEVHQVDRVLRLECATGAAERLRQIAEAFSADITSITLAQPTLEDVFIHLTGHHFQPEGSA